MINKIDHRQINAVVGHNNKKRKVKKPWWNDQLTELWNNVCKAEKHMLKSKNAERQRLRATYVSVRKIFNRECQRVKRKYQKNAQFEIQNMDSKNSKDFGKRIGKIGVGKERQNQIPMEVMLPSGDISSNTNVVLETWRKHFQDLLNPQSEESEPKIETSEETNTDTDLNNPIITVVLKAALRQLNDRKAEGIDEIPAEIWKNQNLLALIEALFNQCFRLGRIPEFWKCGLITPVLKSSSSDKRIPSNYRGITITPAIYKLYCNVINKRLLEWEDENKVICEPQNGFRKGRSTIDHVQSLTSIIETRKLKRQSTFAAFIDFTKAYDSIDRNLLFTKLENLGLNGRIYKAIKSLYDSVKSSVRINGLKTEFVDANCGLKQGCILSTLFFNLYVNDLVIKINSLNIGIDIDGEIVSVMLYADDLVLLATKEEDLQILLNQLNDWCQNNRININEQKSNIVHFRPISVSQTDFSFKCGSKTLDVVNQYIYRGICLTEHLDYTTSSPKGNDAHLRAIIQSEKKWKHQFFRRLRAANSVVHGRIWPNFKLIQALMYVIITSKYEKYPIKNNREKVAKPFFKL